MSEEVPENSGDPQRTPALGREAFYCPYDECGVFAHQEWVQVVFGNMRMLDWQAAMCGACSNHSLWLEDRLVFPVRATGPGATLDMPADVREIYDEARDVSAISRKSAAGLLRLALQMLVDGLEPGPGAINAKIGALVKRGLDPQVQQAMDVLRVVGNEAVHPGVIDLDADDDLLPALFGLVNLIVEQVITRPKHVGGLFGMLPPGKLEGITKRDGGAGG